MPDKRNRRPGAADALPAWAAEMFPGVEGMDGVPKRCGLGAGVIDIRRYVSRRNASGRLPVWFAAAVELGWNPVPERWFTDRIEPACADSLLLWLEGKGTGRRYCHPARCGSWRCTRHQKRRVSEWAADLMTVAPMRVWVGLTTRSSWARIRDRGEHPTGYAVLVVGHDRLLIIADAEPGPIFPRLPLIHPPASSRAGAGKSGSRRGRPRKPVELSGRWMSRRQAINEVRSLAVRLDAVFGSWWSDTWRPRRPEEQSRRLYVGQRRTVILASKLAESLYGEAFPGHVDVATVLAAFENRARAARCALCQQPLTQHCDYEASVAERGLLFCRTCWDSRVPEVTAMVASEGMMIMCDNCGEDVTMRVREHACGDESKRARR